MLTVHVYDVSFFARGARVGSRLGRPRRRRKQSRQVRWDRRGASRRRRRRVQQVVHDPGQRSLQAAPVGPPGRVVPPGGAGAAIVAGAGAVVPRNLNLAANPSLQRWFEVPMPRRARRALRVVRKVPDSTSTFVCVRRRSFHATALQVTWGVIGRNGRT